MKKIRIMILLSVISSTSIAQFNLVPNASFEDTIFGSPCYCGGNIELCVKNWFNPHGATPDYYTYFPGYCSGVNSVNNPSGFQLARTGNAYAGIYGILSPNRDYIAVSLTDSLLPGECYYTEFYVSLANLSRFAIDNIGCYYTNDTSGYKSFGTNIPVVPQIRNQPGVFLSDTLNWAKISGNFVASGGETFLLIGNFYNDLNTPVDTVNFTSGWQGAYYYVDDVLVAPCDSIVGVNHIIPNVIRIFPIPASNELYIFTNQLIQRIQMDLFDLQGIDQTKKVIIYRRDYGWQIDISGLSKGVYILNYTDGSSFRSQYKVIKQ